jgi:DNA-binding NtrC family response regulator/predicted hydrocarbon binding protein
MSTFKYPHNSDLRRLVRFSADDGLIWLAENRMLLMHCAAMSALRTQLIKSVGPESARRILTRMGYESGMRDAELARTIRPGQNPIESFFVGPQLHMLEGSVQVTPMHIHIDLRSGEFDGEFLWEHSWEAEFHLREFGQSADPVCWMQIGYASGYTSAFMGRMVLFKEVECACCGANSCRIIGKPVEEWEDGEQYARYFEPDSRIAHLPSAVWAGVSQTDSAQVTPTPTDLIGSSASFRRAYELVLRAAGTTVTVLLLGETGVGKERFARALHQMSPRKDAPFVAVNCAAIPHDLIESELFGVEKGAFTGAHASRAGKFERAEGGTLFLDEIGEMPLAAQAKLLRALQEGEIERLGDERTRKVNVRVVAATNVDLAQAVKEGRFRPDLYYRVHVYPIHIPPLRDRLADLRKLVDSLVARFNRQHGKHVQGVSDKGFQALHAHHWPGNVRELENVIERGVVLAPQQGWIEAHHLFLSLEAVLARESGISACGKLEQGGGDETRLRLCEQILSAGIPLEELEQLLMKTCVDQEGGNIARAARRLGMSRPKLSYRLQRSDGEADVADA